MRAVHLLDGEEDFVLVPPPRLVGVVGQQRLVVSALHLGEWGGGKFAELYQGTCAAGWVDPLCPSTELGRPAFPREAVG